MPVTLNYPGVYIEELKSQVHTIIGVPTSTAAFVGSASMGPVDEPMVINSQADYDRIFGGLSETSTMSYAVMDFFRNGGAKAIVVRIIGKGASPSKISVGGLSLVAKSPGLWGNYLSAKIEAPNVTIRGKNGEDITGDFYNLLVKNDKSGASERFVGISASVDPLKSIQNIIARSSLIALPQDGPAQTTPPSPTETYVAATGGSDGEAMKPADYAGQDGAKAKKGIYALLKLETEIFNILCLPPISRGGEMDADVLSKALEFCVAKRAILLVDPRANWDSIDAVTKDMANFVLSGESARNAAVYFPLLRMPDQLQNNLIDEFVPCGVVAGIFSRTDRERGVWKAPAGIDASLNGVPELSIKMNDDENGQLNVLGVNCLRSFPIVGRVVWGARTLRGADLLADEWKYLPVRRMALFIEESLYRGTQWVVFEPNDEPLWAQIRLNVGAFMNNLFKQGAFQGRTPKEAYFVKCDSDTTTQNDIDRGIVNILVGFAPLKPAEFVVIQIQQKSGDIQT
jgi:phage tail sheath protein FI